jgi:dolichol-phosphate mannosyltransferase
MPRKARKKIFSVIVPVYQNAENLDDTIPKLLGLQKMLPDYALEVIFVDDGSTDGSYAILERFHKENKETIRVIKMTKNFGQGPAIQAGMLASRGDCVGIISADLQDPYELFVEMIEKWEAGTRLVIAAREGREESASKSLFSNTFWKLVNRYAVSDYPVGGFDFFLIDRKIIDDMNRIHAKNTHIFVLLFSLGYDYEILHYTRQERKAGESQWTLSKKIKLVVDTFVSFTFLPIRGIACLGFTISALSFLYAIVMIINRLIFTDKFEGWTTIITLTTLFGGLTLLTLGIIGEYIWRILDETRNRPIFVVDKVLGSEDEDVKELP